MVTRFASIYYIYIYMYIYIYIVYTSEASDHILFCYSVQYFDIVKCANKIQRKYVFQKRIFLEPISVI